MRNNRSWLAILASMVVSLVAGPVLADAMGDAATGWTAMKSGDNATAIKLFTQAIDSGQLSKSYLELAYVKRGEAYLAAGNQSSALADAQSALALDAANSEAAGVRDRAHGDGVSSYQREQAEAHNSRGLALFSQRDYANALTEFQQAHQLEPANSVMAQNILNTQANLNSEQAEAHNSRGLALFSQRDYANALTEFQQAHQLEPANSVMAQNILNTQNALNQVQAAQSQPAPRPQTSGACKVELAKAAVNIFGGIVALVKHEDYQGPDVDPSQCQGQ